MMPERLRVDCDSAVLFGSRCGECGAAFLGPVEFCRRCTSDRVESIELSRTGTLASYTIVARAPANWHGLEPYALGEVLLPEGVLVPAQIVEWSDGDELRIDDRVELVLDSVGFDDEGRERVVYAWRRIDGEGAA